MIEDRDQRLKEIGLARSVPADEDVNEAIALETDRENAPFRSSPGNVVP